MLRLVLPKGSLEKATLQLFEDADLAVVRSSDVDYRANIDDPRVIDVTILRPQEIPRYVADGLFDLGVTGRDWIEETGADVVTLTELHYSKATARPFRIVLAVAGDSPWVSLKDLPAGVRVQTEYPELTAASSRSTVSMPTSRCRTARPRPRSPRSPTRWSTAPRAGAFRAAGLKVLDTVLVSYTELIANPISYADADKRKAMEQLQTLLTGALEARGRVLVKLNVDEANLSAVIDLAAGVEVADGVEAVRRRRLRGGDGRGQERHQHAHPRAEGHRRDRHPRDPDRQDRPVIARRRPATGSRLRARRDAPRRDHRRRRDGLPVPLHGDRRRHPHDRRAGVP